MPKGWFELKKASNDQFIFNLKAGNAETILTSEQYTTKPAATNGIASVQKNSPEASQYEMREAKNGKPYFVLKAKNHQIIGQSQMYSSQDSANKGQKSVMTNGPTETIKDLT